MDKEVVALEQLPVVPCSIPYTMEYYSAIKRNKTELFVVRWMNLESVIESEVRKRKTNIIC